MKKVLITGSNGMLATAIVDQLKDKYEFLSTSKSNSEESNFRSFDLSVDDYSILKEFAHPEVIIHCAAITDIDFCEQNKIEANSVNALSVVRLLKEFPESKFIFISTDAVFTEPTFAVENSEYNPVNYYGFTKFMAEKYLLESEADYNIIRTTIVGSNKKSKRKSFVDWILENLNNNNNISLFEDSLFNPITTWDLADQIDHIIHNWIPNVVHVNGTEKISKYDFGIKLAEKFDLDLSLISKGIIADKHFVANRNHDMTLSPRLYENITEAKLPDIDETIEEIYQRIK